MNENDLLKLFDQVHEGAKTLNKFIDPKWTIMKDPIFKMYLNTNRIPNIFLILGYDMITYGMGIEAIQRMEELKKREKND